MNKIFTYIYCIKLKFIIKYSYTFGNVNTFREI